MNTTHLCAKAKKSDLFIFKKKIEENNEKCGRNIYIFIPRRQSTPPPQIAPYTFERVQIKFKLMMIDARVRRDVVDAFHIFGSSILYGTADVAGYKLCT